MEKNKTAVEWLFEKLWDEPKDKFTWYALRQKAIEIEKQDKIDFLVWIKENRWHVYKDGKWFTSKDHAYIDGKPRKFYTEEELIQKYNAETVDNVPYKVQNEAN